MSASEITNLIIHLGVIVGNMKPEDDEYRQIYTLLRKITVICMRRAVTHGKIELLDYLIRQHHKLYIKKFGYSITH